MAKFIEKIGHYKSQEAEINKIKYLLYTSMRCSEKRRRWIEKAHHRDGCTYSDNGYTKQADCGCGKLALSRKYNDFIEDMKL